ncbi:hypothetical protein HDU96_010771, partial [Phlyctochytrium bullatum]
MSVTTNRGLLPGSPLIHCMHVLTNLLGLLPWPPIASNNRESLIIDYVLEKAPKTPEGVIATFDEYCYSKGWYMFVGDVKGKIVDEVIKSKPDLKVMAEIGGYIG